MDCMGATTTPTTDQAKTLVGQIIDHRSFKAGVTFSISISRCILTHLPSRVVINRPRPVHRAATRRRPAAQRL